MEKSSATFIFNAFYKDSNWKKRTDVQASLLKAAAFPNPGDTTIARYKPFILQTAAMKGLTRYKDGAFDADDVSFKGTGNNELVVAILIHAGDVPIAHIGEANGLPFWTLGADIDVTWDEGPKKIFRF